MTAAQRSPEYHDTATFGKCLIGNHHSLIDCVSNGP